jgi:hypothetical protein
MAQKAKKPVKVLVFALATPESNNFWQAVNAFNQQHWPQLAQALDTNVVLYGITTQQIIATGRDNVTTFLQNHFAGANFMPLSPSPNFQPPSSPMTASGTARWTDNDGSPPDKLGFLFTFNPVNHLILSLWSQVVS